MSVLQITAKMETPDWYKIPEVPIAHFLACVKPIYAVLTGTPKTKTNGDPFVKTILASHSGMTIDQWERSERERIFEKRLSMVMGDFHEVLMGRLPGFINLPIGDETGMDITNTDKSFFAEVKNRDNTMNSASAETTIRKLSALANAGKKAVLILVNSSKKTLPRFKAPTNVDVWDGKKAYAYFSNRETFHDDLLTTVTSVFSLYPSFGSLESDVTALLQHVRD